jgi:positive regulator of sigma E activity
MAGSTVEDTAQGVVLGIFLALWCAHMLLQWLFDMSGIAAVMTLFICVGPVAFVKLRRYVREENEKIQAEDARLRAQAAASAGTKKSD